MRCTAKKRGRLAHDRLGLGQTLVVSTPLRNRLNTGPRTAFPATSASPLPAC